MTTFTQLTDEVLSLLRGSTRIQDQMTHLVGAVDNDDLTWTVFNGSRLALGRAEVGDEIVQIDSVSTNTVTIAPYGRGVDGSTAAAHPDKAQVIFSPLFSRFGAKRAINDTLLQLGTQLWATKTVEFTANTDGDYALPADCGEVLSVKTEVIDRQWVPVSSWRVVRQADVTDYATGKSIQIFGVGVGHPIEVTYGADPGVLTNPADVFTTVTGLPESCREVVVLGAAWRLLSTVDVGLMDSLAMKNQPGAQPGVGTALSQQLFRMFMTRRDEERVKMLLKSNTGITRE